MGVGGGPPGRAERARRRRAAPQPVTRHPGLSSAGHPAGQRGSSPRREEQLPAASTGGGGGVALVL